MSWADIWAANFFKIDDPSVWESELRREVNGLTESDIIGGIRRMSSDDKTHRRPTLIDLRNAVYGFRKDKTAAPSEAVSDRDLKNTTARAMMNAKSHKERWNILVSCSDKLEICQALDEWAERKWGTSYIRERDQLRASMSSDLRTFSKDLFDELEHVEDNRKHYDDYTDEEKELASRKDKS